MLSHNKYTCVCDTSSLCFECFKYFNEPEGFEK